ncbi:MAG: 5-methyltetrahydropteroyltriglutamate--homocysteine S-methyltransferase [Bacteroidales bacterium]|jgi:5-methyltetrahydropteroyltriglutamate--homocysteine methyltransferase
MLTHNLGYPRIGARRELKKACENYWAGKIGEQELLNAGRLERQKNWKIQKDLGIDLIPCNDFSFYDHVQDMSFMLDAIPDRYRPLEGFLPETDVYFAMCRGYQQNGYDIIAMEMTKWFDTNYHYLVPEFQKGQKFSLRNNKVLSEFLEAREFGVSRPKPVFIGPVSFLLLGKEKGKDFQRMELITGLLPEYMKIFSELQDQGCEYIQLDEPFLVTDLNDEIRSVYSYTYREINKKFPDIRFILATYFGDLGDNLELATNLPVDTLHIDLVRGEDQIKDILTRISPHNNLSLGIIDGRNIWKNNLQKSLNMIHKVTSGLNENRVMLAPSCSLLHVPYDLDNEQKMPSDIKKWLAFARQKIEELVSLKELSEEEPSAKAKARLIINEEDIISRKISKKVNVASVKQKTEKIISSVFSRENPFSSRKRKQEQKLGLPLFPTTTIGSFPQTTDIRKKRREYSNGHIDGISYENYMKGELVKAIRWQEEAGIDVLVHGEFERNDMVEYFSEKLNGFISTENGWVQSYGSRGVKPPVIFGDVSRKGPMTVKWSKFAQSLTDKKVKGMLTGPVTILQWSFVRDDQARMLTAFQIALALREEVLDLEKAGIDIIQIDEPALREGLPLKKRDRGKYLDWAVKSFRVCSSGVKDETQIHTHMCYAEFEDIMNAIADMDADVITIETSRSQMELLDTFAEFNYANQIGPGVYDIHSPRIPGVKEMEHLIEMAMQYIPKENLWINPDCGLKTRKWEEVKPALINMVKTAANLREKVKTNV